MFLRIAGGDAHAFEEAFYEYSDRLYTLLLDKIKQPAVAEEIVQDVFLKVWINRDRLASIDNPGGYIYRIAANLVLDYFRDQAAEIRMKKFSAVAAAAYSPQAGLDSRETQQLINEAVQQLPGQRKLIFELRLQGFSYQEIADQLGLSVHTIRNQIIAGAKFVRVYLVQRGIGPVIILSFYTLL